MTSMTSYSTIRISAFSAKCISARVVAATAGFTMMKKIRTPIAGVLFVLIVKGASASGWVRFPPSL